MIVIYAYNKKEVFPEQMRKPLISYYEEGAMACDGAESERYQFIADSLLCGKDTINSNTLTAE